MSNPYCNPEYDPPADLSPAESRRYEEAIVELLRGPRPLDAELELEGQRPETVLVLRFRVPGSPERLLEARVPLWGGGGPTYELDGKVYLDSAVWKAGEITHRFMAGEFVEGARIVE